MRMHANSLILTVLGFLLVGRNVCLCQPTDSKHKATLDVKDSSNSTEPHGGPKNGSEEYNTRVRRARERWKQTFEEIKSIAVDFSSENQKNERKGRSNLFDQWKSFSEQQSLPQPPPASVTTNFTIVEAENNRRLNGFRQRFDGFQSWEKILANYGKQTKDVIAPVKIELPSERKSYKTFFPRPAKKGEAILPHTDIGDKSKKIWIVTTASLPWMTGTAVNPLLRAAVMTGGRKQAGGKVTLMLPWLEKESDRDKIYGKDRSFDTSEEQEAWIRTWLRDSAGLKEASEVLNISWYIGRYEPMENSLYSMGDITAMIPEEEVDICVLEEPEHLNWYRAPGESWTRKFKHVVGIVHTNYFVYAMEQPAAYLRAPGMRLLSSWMCRAHCHRIIKLSGTLGKFAPEKELIENVHGVRNTFLDYGVKLSKELKTPTGKNHPVFSATAEPKVYFIGKMLWSKGIDSLMELLKYAEESADLKVDFDMYGGGPNFEEAKERSEKLELSMTFHGPLDHAALAPTHKIFVNPSLSEVLCTTVAEALAMGKFVVIPSHPSNDFFVQFPNCLPYANKEEFVGNLYYALTHSPEPLSKECAYALSWEAANQRFAAAGCITENEANEFAELVASEGGGVEIGLPPIIDDEKRRKLLSRTVKNTRERYREFRSNLSHEIRQTNVLPPDIQQSMLAELDKRLELDVDELLSSPKLKLQLSPAELDNQLLELYKAVVDNPTSDALRSALGGSKVGRQGYYLKQQALKAKTKARVENAQNKPQFLNDAGEGDATKWIKQTLRRNLQSNGNKSFLPDKKHMSKTKDSQKNDHPSMMLSLGNQNYHRARTSLSFPTNQHRISRLSSRIPSLLI